MITIKQLTKICHIELNRPEKKNALHPLMMEQLISAIEDAVSDAEISVIVLSGAGDAFCAGADLAHMLALSSASKQENENDVELLDRFFTKIHHCAKPVIAAVDGAALAGGCGLAIAADVVVASEERALFGFPEVKRGFIPALVSNILLSRTNNATARRLLIGGEIINAAEAYRLGMVDIISSQPIETALHIAEQWAANPVQTMVTIKKMLIETNKMAYEDKQAYVKKLNFEGRFTPEFSNGIQSFLRKNK